MSDAIDWTGVSRRNARSVQTTIGWIFWDPGAVRRYAELGLPDQLAGPLGYMAARCAPLAGAGPDAVIAAFGSITPMGIRGVFGLLQTPERFIQMWEARDEAVVDRAVVVRHEVEVLAVEDRADVAARAGLQKIGLHEEIAAIKADTASLIAWQVGMYGFMAFVQFYLYPQLAGRPAPVNSVEFWFAMQFAMLAGFLTSYPVNWWLVGSGIKEKM